MPDTAPCAKHERMLELCLRLMDGEVIRKDEAAAHFGVDVRSVQRDIADLRCFLADHGGTREIYYDHRRKGYCLAYAAPPAECRRSAT